MNEVRRGRHFLGQFKIHDARVHCLHPKGVKVKEHFSELVNTEVTSVSRRFVAFLSP